MMPGSTPPSAQISISEFRSHARLPDSSTEGLQFGAVRSCSELLMSLVACGNMLCSLPLPLVNRSQPHRALPMNNLACCPRVVALAAIGLSAMPLLRKLEFQKLCGHEC